jgi:hypothetical protein
MSCSYYIHNDPIGGTKYVSGTTCTGEVAYYYLTYGQGVCMNNYLPLLYENGVVIDGDCTGVTPTPTPSPQTFCYTKTKTFTTTDFYCGFNGVTYENITGTIGITIGSSSHPDYSFTLSNGVDTAVVSIPNGQTYTEFTYQQITYSVGNDGSCVEQLFVDYNITSAPIGECLAPTPTPTRTPNVTSTPTLTPTPNTTSTPTLTPSVTPTKTPGSTPTPTQTPAPDCDVTYVVVPSPTPTSTLTPTPTPAPGCDVTYILL